MTELPVLVVGGGPAGVAAAVTLAEASLRVLLIEQRDRLGGAIHRQPAPGAPQIWRGPARHRRNWTELTSRLERVAARIELRTSSVFLGVDGAGRFLFEDCRVSQVFARRVRAAIVAVGAIERIRPFEGWELPGVMSAGGAQILLKETGRPPEGPIVVAGSGPLLLAVAAQLARAGNPPLAVLERGNPWRRPKALASLMTAGPQLAEAAAYGTVLALKRVPYRIESEVLGVTETGQGLTIRVRLGKVERLLQARHLLVHDGLEPNRIGIPLPAPEADVPVFLAGDGREIHGADAAMLDGQRAAAAVLASLGRTAPVAALETALGKARAFQRDLAEALRSPPTLPSPETMICRCEGRRYADFTALPADASAREIRLMGRFGLGACQARFCGPMLAELRGEPLSSASPPRWPLRPVSLAALANFSMDQTET
ncbi:FAD-dependent oxidoreductase [Bosea sp. (in: a-proteobacteria)]|uniref:FAD-dependent oxidoreductase n=1 Tax=Bosea sp. (in: a-proteobacteria) TaxID=1871050 RepID=UPI002DDD0204|nr:FAD-dependent oxidoreductase [Bosea sp. (in: a-proteobacteria)]